MSKLQNGHELGADLGELLPELTHWTESNHPHGTVDRAVHCGTGPGLVQEFETRCGRFLVSCQFCMQGAQWAKRPRGWERAREPTAGGGPGPQDGGEWQASLDSVEVRGGDTVADKGGLWAKGRVSPPEHQQEVGRHPDGGSFIDCASYQEAEWAKRPRGWDGAGVGPQECGEWQAGLDGVGVQGGNAVADEDGPWAEACINPLVHQQGVGSHPHGSSSSDGASYQVTHELSAMMLPERTLCHRVDWGVVQTDIKDGLTAGPAPCAMGTPERRNRPMVPRGGVMSKLQNGHKQRADLGELLPEPTYEPASNSPHGTVDRAVHCGTGPGLVHEFETRCGRFLVFCQFCMQEAQWAKRPRGWDDGSEAGAGSQGSDPATEEDVPGLLEDSESDCESGAGQTRSWCAFGHGSRR